MVDPVFARTLGSISELSGLQKIHKVGATGEGGVRGEYEKHILIGMIKELIEIWF